SAEPGGLCPRPPLGGALFMSLIDERAFAEPQAIDGQPGADRQPDQVHPPRRPSQLIEQYGSARDDRPDDQNQEGSRPVADIVAVEVEPAGSAPPRKACEARK